MDRSSSSARPTTTQRLATCLTGPGVGVFSRSLAAMLGGYALASVTSVFCAVALPGARGQAVLTGMLVAIIVCACAALWAFAARTALHAWTGILLPALLMAAVARALGAWA